MLKAVSFGIVTALLLWLGVASSAFAAGPCSYAINGASLDAAATPAQAIEVASGDEVVLTAAGPGPLGEIRVDVVFWPFSAQAYVAPATTASTSTGSVRLIDQGITQQGLYHVRVDEGLPECPPTEGWVKVSGGIPFLTIPGAAGTAAAGGGIALILAALRRAGGGRGAFRMAAIGGASLGVGALVVGQQAGVAPIDAGSVALWTGSPSVVGMGLTSLVGRRSARQESEPTVWARQDRVIPRADWPRPGDLPSIEPSAPPPAPSAAPPPVYAEPGGPSATEVVVPADVGEGAAPSDVAADGWPSEPAAPATVAAGPEEVDLSRAAPPPMSAATIGAEVDPPRISYARLDAPDAVVAETTFEVVVGLGEAPDLTVGTAPLVRPAWSVGPYTLTVQLLADGFERMNGGPDPWRLELDVTASEPYPVATLKLRSAPAERPVRVRQIRALYAVKGQALGDASRPVAVVDAPARLADLEPGLPRPPESLSTPRGEEAPDLTIRIEHRDDEAGGAFTWQVLVRDGLGVRPTSNPSRVDLGDGAAEFLRTLTAEVAANEGKATMRQTLLGIGRDVSRQVPEEFWDIFSRVLAAVAPQPPSIQILSAEPYVPWELAVLPDDTPRFDSAAPPYLGAQADVGRWVLGRRPPGIPPPARVIVQSMAVISGVFAGSARLEEAEAEASEIASEFSADPVQATGQAVLDCLAKTPPYNVIHFAIHGSYTSPGVPGGASVDPILFLADGETLNDHGVMGSAPLPGTPLVFLNACQVGGGLQVLGDYAGLAAAFLYAGASGVIAPLWSIDDRAAREIGRRFYQRVFAGASPATVMRLERASFLSSPETASSTFLAYQFYGHPSLKLERVQP